jgi:hypothetical protein
VIAHAMRLATSLANQIVTAVNAAKDGVRCLSCVARLDVGHLSLPSRLMSRCGAIAREG